MNVDFENRMARVIGEASDAQMDLNSMSKSFVRISLRFRSAIDSFSVACEAFSEHPLLL